MAFSPQKLLKSKFDVNLLFFYTKRGTNFIKDIKYEQRKLFPVGGHKYFDMVSFFKDYGVEYLVEPMKNAERTYIPASIRRHLSACQCFGRQPARLPCPPGCILSSGSVDGAAAVSARVWRKMLISSVDGDFKGKSDYFLRFADQLHPAHPFF